MLTCRLQIWFGPQAPGTGELVRGISEGFPFHEVVVAYLFLAVVTQQWHIIEQANPVSLSLLARSADLYNLLIQVVS